MDKLNNNITSRLREMARQGDSVASMFHELKNLLGADGQIVTILDYLRAAFCLSLAEVKPVAALSRNDRREIKDEQLLDQLLRLGFCTFSRSRNIEKSEKSIYSGIRKHAEWSGFDPSF